MEGYRIKIKSLGARTATIVTMYEYVLRKRLGLVPLDLSRTSLKKLHEHPHILFICCLHITNNRTSKHNVNLCMLLMIIVRILRLL